MPVAVFEKTTGSRWTPKAGTVLTRTLEVLRRYGVLPGVLRASLRIDEIGEIDRATNEPALRRAYRETSARTPASPSSSASPSTNSNRSCVTASWRVNWRPCTWRFTG